MAKFRQFRFHEQVFGTRTLPQPIRPISRHRIPLGVEVRKSLLGHSFPKTGKYPKEVTYRIRNNNQERFRFYVGHIPTSPAYDAPWFCFSTAVHLWQTMSDIEREPFNVEANALQGMSGYNLFIREFMNDNYPL